MSSSYGHKFDFGKSLSNAISLLKENEGVSTHLLLLSAFITLLHRYSGQENILVVSTIEGTGKYRALNTDFSGEPTFNELLYRVNQSYQETVEFEEVIEKHFPNKNERNLKSSFQVFFGFNAKISTEELLNKGFNLILHITPTKTGFENCLSYDPDYYHSQEIILFARHLGVLLESIIGNPDEYVSMLSLLTPEDRHQLLVEWNDTKAEYDQQALLHTLIEEQSSRTPDARAVIFDGHDFSFAELNRRANRLAHYLLSFHLKPETLIGVCMERSFDMVVGLLGVLKAGCAYVPMDPAYPSTRLAFIAEDTKMPIILTQAHLQATLPPHQAQIIILDMDNFLSGQPENNPDVDINSQNLVCILYTSGSTGQPKGVMLSHQNIIARFQSSWNNDPFHAGDVYAQTASICFIDHVEEIFLPLIYGGSTQILPLDVVKSPRLLIEALGQYETSRFIAVPSLLKSILNNVPDIGRRLPKLKICNSSGEALTQDLQKEFHQKLPHVKLYNAYGSTETTADATVYNTIQPSDGPCVPIGRPYENVQVYVLDGKLQPVPIGFPGEIHVGGTSIARGYFNRPDLTADNFIPDPFSQDPHARLFRTGDLGRYLPSGDIEFLGRLDDQVKIRGMRVELGEIEMTLKQHPDVKECIVVAKQGEHCKGGGTTRLIGYVVSDKRKKPSCRQLQEFLRAKLPDHSIPAFIVVMDAFPLTPNDKVDKGALPKPDQSQNESIGNFDPPRDPTELKLAIIFEELLGLSPIGINDSFFDLGGDSLMAVELLAEIERVFDRNLPMSLLIKAYSIANIAIALRGESENLSWSSLVPIQPSGSKPPFFCVHADGGILLYRNLSNMLGADQPFYGIQAQGLDGQRPPFKCVEDMAAHYIQEIKHVQPSGPYNIGAYSLGAIVLFEMAHQLLAANEQVGLLAFFDAHGPEYPQFAPGTSYLGYKISVHRKSLNLLDLRGKLCYLRNRTKNRLRVYYSVIFSRLYAKLNIAIPHTIRYNHVRETIFKAADNYHPKPYPGTITIFRATNQPEGIIPDDTLGWSEYVSGTIDIVEVEGSHYSILNDPHLQCLAQKLEEQLTAVNDPCFKGN